MLKHALRGKKDTKMLIVITTLLAGLWVISCLTCFSSVSIFYQRLRLLNNQKKSRAIFNFRGENSILLVNLKHCISKSNFFFLLVDLAPGGSDDWIYDLGIKYSFTIELRDKGKYGFLLPERYIKPTCTEALAAVSKIAGHVIKNV